MNLRFDQDGTYGPHEGGLKPVENRRIATLTQQERVALRCSSLGHGRRCPFLSGCTWTAAWFVFTAPKLDAWGAGVDASSASKDKLSKTSDSAYGFDVSDGVRTSAVVGSSSPVVGKSADGKLCSRLRTASASVDPPLRFNRFRRRCTSTDHRDARAMAQLRWYWARGPAPAGTDLQITISALQPRRAGEGAFFAISWKAGIAIGRTSASPAAFMADLSPAITASA